MPRCSHCGKVNREGSLFCQDCGHRLEAAPAQAKPAAAAGGAPQGAVCSSCGTTNPPGMNFCKMCGTSLAAKAPAPAASPAPSVAMANTMMASPEMAAPQPVATAGSGPVTGQAGKLNCPACGKQTPAGFSFCQHCGQRLTAPGQAQQNTLRAPSGPVAVSPTPPAGMPRPSAKELAAQARVSDADAMGKTLAPTPEVMAQLRAVSQARMPASAQPQPQAVAETLAAPSAARKVEPLRDTAPDETPRAAGARFGQLVAVNRDGSDGQTVELTGETFDIGRSEGSLLFADDPYLAPRHVRLIHQGGKVLLRPIDTVNGVYVRVHGTTDLSPGDQFLTGKEVIRFEPLSAEERDPPSLSEHGVRLFGTVPREAWARLRQISVAGTTRDVWHLVRPELVLGREEGDVTFPDDEFMSRRHAAVKRVGSKAKLEDLSSSNGTYLRVRGDRELRPGDVVRLGDQLLRFEQ